MPAPYSDNLYSADDSDLDVSDDDLNTHLSPTDGYFQRTSSSVDNLYPPQQEHDQPHHANVTNATLPTSAGVPHVPNVLVEDPSLKKGASKDREAREETRLNIPAPQTASSPAAVHDDDVYDGFSTTAGSEATPSHTTYTSHARSSSSYTPYSPSTDAPLRTPQTHSRRSLFSYPASLSRIPREAPPAYTPSPTSPLSSSPTEFRNYHTFSSTMGAPEEERRLLGRDPESMGDEPYDDDPRPTPWRERVLRKYPWASRRTLKMALLVALVFAVFVGFLSMFSRTAIHVPSKTPSQPVKEYDPVTGLPIKDGPEAPPESGTPSQPGQPGQPTRPLPWNPQSMCAQAEHRFGTKVYGLSFSADKSLSVLQTVDNDTPSNGYQPHVSGDFVIRRQLTDAPGPSIELEVVANDERLDVHVEWEEHIQQLKIKTPRTIAWSNSQRPCMTVRATVWVPENAEIKVLQLAALNLGVQLVDDLAVKVLDQVEIRTLSGDVKSPAEPPASYNLDSRNIIVHTISGDISGSWPLYDFLQIGTDSGDIVAGVEPKPVLESKPLPAVLEVTTVSGDIVVKEPLGKASENVKPDTVIPPRDYITSIDTKSGMIRVWATFSSNAVLTTISGDINAILLPVYDVSLIQSVPTPELHTNTKSGTILLNVLEPLWVEIENTLSGGGKAPKANPNEPVDIPTNPVPVPSIPKLPRIPRVPKLPLVPIGARDPYRHLPGSGRRWSDLIPGRRSLSYESDATRSVSAQDNPPMRRLKSTHETVSGNVKIWYPASWEGTVEAETISGKIDVRGKDVKIERRNKWPKSVRAVKGQRWACDATIKTVSGNELLTIGSEE